MSPEERKRWTARGFKDPVTAFREHLRSALARGIPFRLTFDEWWSLWEPHYERRGREAGQMCMCRTHDQGAYELGNVRIDTVKGNAAEHGMVRRTKSSATAYIRDDAYRPKPPETSISWMWHNRFAPYSEG